MDCAVIAWSGAPVPATRARAHLRLVAQDLTARARACGAATGRAGVAAAALDALHGLPDAGLVRVLGAPETYFQLGEAARAPEADDLLDHMRGWVDAERARATPGYRPHRPAWSALGDAYFPAQGRAYRAPRAGGIPVDGASPYARRPIRASAFRRIAFGPVEMLSAEALADTVDKLERALAGLGRISPAARDFVGQVVRVIMPRRDPVNAAFYTSSSSRDFIGLVKLVNPHLPKITPATLTSSLVHEAIHAFLYMRELQRPLVLDRAALADVQIRSPWTGGALSAVTYVHACFVWFGLARLWSLPGAAEVYGAAEAERQRARALVGFERGADGPLAPVAAQLAPDVLAQIRVMSAACRRPS